MHTTFRFTVRLLLAALCGCLIAWIVTLIVLSLHFMGGGYTREALIELPVLTMWLIGAGGAAACAGLAAIWGKLTLPPWNHYVAVGAVLGVAVAVFSTLAVAITITVARDLPGKGLHSPTMEFGLYVGAPMGLVTGAIAGRFVWWRMGRKRGGNQ
jgi:hypothetical protein